MVTAHLWTRVWYPRSGRQPAHLEGKGGSGHGGMVCISSPVSMRAVETGVREPQVGVNSPGGSREKGVEWGCTHAAKCRQLSSGVATNDSERRENSEKDAVAPCLRVGRGLKPIAGRAARTISSRCALPSGGARIETRPTLRVLVACEYVAPCLRVGRGLKPRRPAQALSVLRVAPCLRVGRGLKHDHVDALPAPQSVAPCLRVGRGLKHPCGRRPRGNIDVAPCLRVGRGLKPIHKQGEPRRAECCALPSGGARIET